MSNKVAIAKPILDDLQEILNKGISVDSSVDIWKRKHSIREEDWLSWKEDNRDRYNGMIRAEIFYKRANKY